MEEWEMGETRERIREWKEGRWEGGEGGGPGTEGGGQGRTGEWRDGEVGRG